MSEGVSVKAAGRRSAIKSNTELNVEQVCPTSAAYGMELWDARAFLEPKQSLVEEEERFFKMRRA